MENELPRGCLNCNGECFIVDWERGSSVCEACGCVFESSLRIGGQGYRGTHDAGGNKVAGVAGYESVLAGAYTESISDFLAAEKQTYRNGSPPYRRQTYWAERISQWREQEPAIDADDKQAIEDEYWKLTNPWLTSQADMYAPFKQLEWRWTDDLRDRFCYIRGTNLRYVVTKDDCRVILWSIDKQRQAIGGKPIFVKKYLVSFAFLFAIAVLIRFEMFCISSAVHERQRGTCVQCVL